jgi:hypothetical protein
LPGEQVISESIYPVSFFLTAICHEKGFIKPDETFDFPVGCRQEQPTGVVSLSANRQANILFPVDLILSAISCRVAVRIIFPDGILQFPVGF